MKKLLLLLSFASVALCGRADTFTLKYVEVPSLINALSALDGYDRSIDQGPGNPPRVIRENYKLSRDTRTRLAANLAALVKAYREFNDKLADLRESISGKREKIDDTDPAQMKAWLEKTKSLGEVLTLELSPITAAELTDNDNPIPISTLSVLNLLRPAAK